MSTKGHSNSGNYVGSTGSYLNGGVFNLKYQELLKANNAWGLEKNGLRMHWDPADPNSYSGSGSTIYDLSGNGQNGTIVNTPTYTTSIGSGSFTVNPSSQSSAQYINGGAQSCGNTGTFNMWFYTTNWVSYNNPFGTQGLTGGTNAGYRVEQYNTGGGPSMGLVCGNDAGTYNGTTLIAGNGLSNTWYNLCWTWNQSGSRVTTYLNGANIATISNTYFASTFPGITWGDGFSTGRYFQGNLGVFMYYTTELSAQQVNENFTYYRKRYGV
jgi:hypothetical protein